MPMGRKRNAPWGRREKAVAAWTPLQPLEEAKRGRRTTFKEPLRAGMGELTNPEEKSGTQELAERKLKAIGAFGAMSGLFGGKLLGCDGAAGEVPQNQKGKQILVGAFEGVGLEVEEQSMSRPPKPVNLASINNPEEEEELFWALRGGNQRTEQSSEAAAGTD